MPTRNAISIALLALIAHGLTLGAATAVAAPVKGLAHAESLYVSGDLAAAAPAFAALKGAPDDTSIVLRRAALALFRNDLHGARAALAPLKAKPALSRSANAILAESYARELDFARAAPIRRLLGHEASAKQLESFAGVTPYRYEGPDRVTVKFVQTDPLPVIEAKVDGRGPYFFLIDTGGSQLALDPVLADSLGAPRFGEEQGTFAGGKKSPVGLSRVGSLTLGDGTFHDVPVSLLDCSRFSPMAGGRRIMGMLGTLLLMRTRATLDYPGSALIMERRAAGASGATADSTRHVMPMWLAGDHFILARGRLDDGPESLWFVDSGLAGAAVTAPGGTLAAAGLTVPDTASSTRVGVGGGGGAKFQIFPVKRFTLGDVSGGNLMGIFGAFPPTLEYAFGPRIAGIISHAFLRSWRVTFDFDAMQLVLEKPAATTSH